MLHATPRGRSSTLTSASRSHDQFARQPVILPTYQPRIGRTLQLPHVSNNPFGDALRELMNDRGLTYRELAQRTRRLDGKGMTHAHINMLANGHDRPSTRAMELIAEACGVEPGYFAE